MKAMTTISMMILAAGMAAGQAKPAQKPAAPASQSPATKMTTTTAAKPTSAKTTTAKTTAAKPAAKLGAASMVAKPAAKPAAAKKEAPTEWGKNKRDPFISPVVIRMGDQAMGCSTGKRCLVIDQLTLEGVVKTVNGWIAVIGNPSKKVYYLRENDALFDGFVKRITGDSVVFQQNTVDTVGKAGQREVVKRITPSA